MNKSHFILPLLGAVLFTACTDNDTDNSYLLRPTAVVTVCPDSDGSFIMQLDDNTQLIPSNLTESPFGAKEVRALVNYTEEDDAASAVRKVRVNWLDSIRTKAPVPSLGETNDITYGNDPIEIVQDWVTVAEDGYLTLRFRTVWGPANITHTINLLTGTNPDDPSELLLCHNAAGDTEGRWGDALIAFNLNSLPCDTDGKAKFKLRWNSFSGEKTIDFDIKMRPAKQNVDIKNVSYSAYVK